jgi:hypothetical protein
MPPEPLVIVRLLPVVDSEPRYRVMSTIDGHQRAMPESQIRLMPTTEGEPPAVHLLLSLRTDDDNTVVRTMPRADR